MFSEAVLDTSVRPSWGRPVVSSPFLATDPARGDQKAETNIGYRKAEERNAGHAQADDFTPTEVIDRDTSQHPNEQGDVSDMSAKVPISTVRRQPTRREHIENHNPRSDARNGMLEQNSILHPEQSNEKPPSNYQEDGGRCVSFHNLTPALRACLRSCEYSFCILPTLLLMPSTAASDPAALTWL